MSLLSDAMELCNIYTSTIVDDGYGGYKRVYVKGTEINAAITFDSSMEARVAESQGVKSLYTITTARNLVLEYHDVIVRQRDNKAFRITSDGDDKFTPKSALLDMRQVTAEEFTFPK